MFSGRATRGLLWKEIRQLVPLILMLIGVGLCLIVIWWLVQRANMIAGIHDYLPWTLPILFSVGAGAVLVGQEKEQSSLWWLVAQPITPNQIIATKIVASVIGLAIVWGISLLLIVAMGNGLGGFFAATDSTAINLIDALIVVLQSVFLLGCGLFTSWWFGNTFLSLVAILPLATIPPMLSALADSIHRWKTGYLFMPDQWKAPITLASLVLAVVVIYLLIFYAGRKVLAPAKAPRIDDSTTPSMLDAWRPTVAAPPPTEPYRYPISAILWQMLRHSRWPLLAIGTLMLLGSWWAPKMATMEPNKPSFSGWMAIAGSLAIAGWLATSWLGVLVFSGDGRSQRLRFLAERGVSPMTAWLGRQLVGASLISIATIVYAISVYGGNGDFSRRVPLPSAAMIALTLWLTFGISQWTAQLVSTLGISVILAPFLALVGFYWLGFSAVELSAPLWLLILCSCLPLLATFLSMRRFMDGSHPLWRWGMGVATAFLFVTSPLIPFAVDVAGSADMPREVRSQLLAAANQIPLRNPYPLTLEELPISNLDSFEGISAQQAMEAYRNTDFGPQGRFSDLGSGENQTRGLSADHSMIHTAFASAILSLLAYEASPENQDAMQSLSDWVEALVQFARGFRASQKLTDQEMADVLEIWLARTLARDSIQPLRSQPAFASAIELVTDADGRSQARREAVLASWKIAMDQRDNDPFAPIGGYTINHESNSSTRRYWTHNKGMDAFVDATIRLIDAGSAGKPTESIRRELHELVVGPRIRFEDGPYSKRIRASRDTGSVATMDQTLRYPANQWFAPWETDAMQLLEPVNPADSVDTGDDKSTTE